MFQRENVETILILWTTLNANERDSEDLGISCCSKKKKKKKLWETNFVTNYLQQTSTSIVFLFSLGDLGRYEDTFYILNEFTHQNIFFVSCETF